MIRILFLSFLLGIESLYSLPNTDTATTIENFYDDEFEYEFDYKNFLGNGSYGFVYKGTREKISSPNDIKKRRKEEVAFKKMAINNEHDMIRCENEVLINEYLDHKNIMKYYSGVLSEGSIFLVLELLKGNTLKAAIYKEQSFPESKACNVFRQLVLAIEHLEEKKIVHRDIKPGNIFIDDNGKVSLFDFGLSVDLNFVKHIQNIHGTHLYMSPDLLIPEYNQDEGFFDITMDKLRAGDIYSLGVTLLEMLEGRNLMKLLNIKTVQDFILNRFLYGNKELSREEIFHKVKSHRLQKEILELIHPDPAKRPSISTIKKEYFCFHQIEIGSHRVSDSGGQLP